jgi:hypothetical protein
MRHCVRWRDDELSRIACCGYLARFAFVFSAQHFETGRLRWGALMSSREKQQQVYRLRGIAHKMGDPLLSK